MDKLKKYLILLLLLLAVFAAGCGASASGQKTYGKEDTNICVDEGKTFTIALNENPTTGYSWTYAISDEGIIAKSKDVFEAESTDTQLVGAGGMRIVSFKGLKKGSAIITFVYERSWEKNPEDEKIVYNVEVK